MSHIHSVRDTDTHFIIDKDTREIKHGGSTPPLIVQYDHNSERLSFELPRHIDGHDMTSCNQVRVNYLNIDASTKGTQSGVYEVTDLAPLPGDTSKALCSWLISSNATQYAGKLNFVLSFACVDGSGAVTYAWHTAIYTDLAVVNGLDNGEEVALPEYVDILAQWKADLFGTGDTVEAEIVAKGEEVKATIPEDYTALSEQADATDRSKAPAIVVTAEGESIAISGSSDCYLRGLRVYGKSTQDGTPTPTNPVEIVSLEAPSIDVYGANLANIQNMTLYANTALDISEDGYVIKAVGGGNKGYVSSTTYLNAAMLAGKSIIFSADSITTENADAKAVVQLNIFSAGKKDYEPISTDLLKRTLEIPADTYEITLDVYTNNNAEALAENNTVIAKGVGVYLVDVEWEAYKEKKSITLTPTLHGIPVTSGGNYTDENGYQWICDEIDLAKGVHVQRIGVAAPYIDEVITGPYLSTTGELSSGATVLYALDEPIEAALSDEEIAAFKALHSNYPNTTVINSAGAHMAVDYVADTKMYIDKKIAEMMTVD